MGRRDVDRLTKECQLDCSEQRFRICEDELIIGEYEFQVSGQPLDFEVLSLDSVGLTLVELILVFRSTLITLSSIGGPVLGEVVKNAQQLQHSSRHYLRYSVRLLPLSSTSITCLGNVFSLLDLFEYEVHENL